MLLHCHSRRCNTTRDHKLKVDNNEAVCMDCGEINNLVSDFMKAAMKASGDIYRAAGGRKAFMYKCPKCTIDRGVRIVNEQALCESCRLPLNLSKPMIEAIKSSVPKTAAEVVVEPTDEDDSKPKAEFNKGIIKRHKE